MYSAEVIYVRISPKELSESPKLIQSKDKFRNSGWADLKIQHSQSYSEEDASNTKSEPVLFECFGIEEYTKLPVVIYFEASLEKKRKEQIEKNLEHFNFECHGPNYLFDPFEPLSQLSKLINQLSKQKDLTLNVETFKTAKEILSLNIFKHELSLNNMMFNNQTEKLILKSFKRSKEEKLKESEGLSPTDCQVLTNKNDCNEKNEVSVKQLTSSFSSLIEDQVERELYEMAGELPQNMALNVSLHKDRNGMRKINLDVTSWNKIYQAKIQSLFEKIDCLFIRTETPETVLPWILQFPNLRILNIATTEGTLNAEHELAVDQTTKIKLDMEALAKVATFDESLTITFSCNLDENNQDIMKYLVKIYAQFKDKRKLRQLRISQYLTSLIPKITQYYKNAKLNEEL